MDVMQEIGNYIIITVVPISLSKNTQCYLFCVCSEISSSTFHMADRWFDFVLQNEIAR
jgi:hypothetical protein